MSLPPICVTSVVVLARSGPVRKPRLIRQWTLVLRLFVENGHTVFDHTVYSSRTATPSLAQETAWPFSTNRRRDDSQRTLACRKQLLPAPGRSGSLSSPLTRSTPSHTTAAFFTTHGAKVAEKDPCLPDCQGYPRIRCRCAQSSLTRRTLPLDGLRNPKPEPYSVLHWHEKKKEKKKLRFGGTGIWQGISLPGDEGVSVDKFELLERQVINYNIYNIYVCMIYYVYIY